jgi:PAS domain-containing protein
MNPTEPFVVFRQTLLRQTADVVLKPEAAEPAYCADSFPRVAAMLASSLEELHVAEEEIASQSVQMAIRQAELSRDIEYEHRLFDQAPTVLLTTDLNGGITEANRAAQELFEAEMYYLDRKPITMFVPTEDRSAFRKQLSRMPIVEGATDWRFRLIRTRNVPIEVTAAGRIVVRGSRIGGAALFWSIRALTPDERSVPVLVPDRTSN